MSAPKLLLGFALWVAWVGLLPVCETHAGHGNEPNALPILQSWRGDYPVSQSADCQKASECLESDIWETRWNFRRLASVQAGEKDAGRGFQKASCRVFPQCRPFTAVPPF